MSLPKLALSLLCLAPLATLPAQAAEIRISAPAFERTLRTQLFNAPDTRYYIRGTATTPCFVYADNPKVTFHDDRIFVHVHARAKLGTTVRGSCVGVSLNTETDVSFVPEARASPSASATPASSASPTPASSTFSSNPSSPASYPPA